MSVISTAQKEAMAHGRSQSRVVDAYLTRLQETRPRRGRKRTPESIRKRLVAIEAALPEATILQALQLTQERTDLTHELASLEKPVNIAKFEKDFIKVAAEYGDRKGLGFDAWRSVGVPVEVLKKAGITP